MSVEEYRPEGAAEQQIFDADGYRLWDSCAVIAHFALEHDLEGTFQVRGGFAGTC